jgi:hypothetical protein
MGRAWRMVGVAIAIACAWSPRASAQAPKVMHGVVRRLAGRDSLAEANVRVVLHKVGQTIQGPIDSLVADAAGKFSFKFTPDTSAIYLVSSRHAGIEYFSTPVPLAPGADSLVTVLTYDTTSTGRLTLDFRNLVVNRGSDDGARRVLELLIVKNAGDRTVVGRDSLQSTWGMPLPKGAIAFQPGPGDFSPEAIQLRNDSVVVFAPISPGDKQIILEYTLPAAEGALKLPLSPASTVNLLIEDRNAKLSGAPLAAADSDRIQGKVYQRFSGTIASAAVLTLDVPNPRAAAKQLVWWLVGALGLTLAVGTALLLKPQAAAAPVRMVGRRQSATDLVDAIARIDVELKDPHVSERERHLLATDRAALAVLAHEALRIARS